MVSVTYSMEEHHSGGHLAVGGSASPNNIFTGNQKKKRTIVSELQ